MPINAAVCALLHPAKRHGVDKRHGPPLKLIFVLCRERLRALKVFRGGMHIERDAGKASRRRFSMSDIARCVMSIPIHRRSSFSAA